MVAGSFPVEKIADPLFDDSYPLSADFCPFSLKPDSLPLVADSFQVDDKIVDSCLLVADSSVDNLLGVDPSLVGLTAFEIVVVVVEIVEIFHYVDLITNPKKILLIIPKLNHNFLTFISNTKIFFKLEIPGRL